MDMPVIPALEQIQLREFRMNEGDAVVDLLTMMVVVVSVMMLMFCRIRCKQSIFIIFFINRLVSTIFMLIRSLLVLSRNGCKFLVFLWKYS